MRVARRLALFVLGASGVGHAAGADALYALIDARLELMQAVAAQKFLEGLPIEDLARERIVVAAAVDDGLRSGLVPASSAALFEAQIDAAKQIQRYWFDRWLAAGPPEPIADLDSVVRPQLLELGADIVDALAAPGIRHSRERFDAIVSVVGLSLEQRSALFDALDRVERFSSRLEQVLATETLRVGTTGDYAPFSLRTSDGPEYEGIDIDLARDLAEALGVRVKLVATSWPTLSADLASGSFDIAMSGVSRTLERARLGMFSTPYYTGGKTPIVRCGEVQEYDSLEEIDRPHVRVVVNPGGTNETFVNANLRSAAVRVHADNRTIFTEIVQGAADVMITDRIEVEWQSRLHPELCASMSEDLTYQEKAYLLPRDAALKTFVDTWLSLRTGDGTLAATFARHLDAVGEARTRE